MNIIVHNNYITYLSSYFESAKTYYSLLYICYIYIFFFFICNVSLNVVIRNDKYIVFRRLPRELLREAQRLAGDPMQRMRKLRVLQIWTSHSLQEMPLEQTPLRLSYPSLCQQVQRLLWPALKEGDILCYLCQQINESCNLVVIFIFYFYSILLFIGVSFEFHFV